MTVLSDPVRVLTLDLEVFKIPFVIDLTYNLFPLIFIVNTGIFININVLVFEQCFWKYIIH